MAPDVVPSTIQSYLKLREAEAAAAVEKKETKKDVKLTAVVQRHTEKTFFFIF